MIYAYITGGGTKWIYNSLKKGGASKWFLGARIPYNQKDFDEILGGRPFDGKYVSERTAAQLSVAAWKQANKLCGEEYPIGLGVTSKLKTKGQRKGRENKIIMAITKNSGSYLRTYTKEYTLPSWMCRNLQEILCSYYINQFIGFGFDNCYDSWTLPYLNELKFKNSGLVVYSGSFNPIHESHIAILNECSKLFTYHEYVVEISDNNFSKGVSGPYELFHRRKEIQKVSDAKVVFSNCSTFLEKAKILKANGYPSIIFPMGDDTYDRITENEKDELLKMGGISILLFKRKYDTFKDSHPIIHEFSYKLPNVPSISSTEIRNNAIQQ
jgi:nicotinic acid mononucleotide adenylyltransferase